MITIKETQFDNNPSGMNPNILFMGTVHTGTGIQENVYGFTEDEVIELARKLKELNKDFSIVHIYAPSENLRTKIGYRLL